MQVIVLLDGLTFGGRVWKAGEVVDTERYDLPAAILTPEYRDSQGRRWFRTYGAPEVEEAPTEITPKDGPTVLACRYCGKEYKSADWLARHEQGCGESE